MFTSLELGRGEEELDRGGLSLRKNPLLVSIVDGVETLRALLDRGQLKPDDVAGARALIVMRTDKIGFGISVTQGYGLLVARRPPGGAGAGTGGGGGWSAPLPLKVDGFSLGAVAGYSEQRSVILLGSDDDVAVFLRVRVAAAAARWMAVPGCGCVAWPRRVQLLNFAAEPPPPTSQHPPQ